MNTTEPQTDELDPREPRGSLKAPRVRPPLMTFGLIAVNLLMALVQWAGSGFPRDTFPEYSHTFTDWVLGAKVPSLVEHGEYWRLVTANFLHGSVTHLLINMISLLVLGRLVELYYGPLRALVIFTLSCVAGAIVSYKTTPSISLGASTGVMGLLTAMLVHNWKYRRFLPDRVNSMFPVLLVMLILQFVMDSLSPSTIDTMGHAGGALGGAVLGALVESRIAGRHQSERDWLPLPTAVATAVLLLAYGAWGIVSTLPSQLYLLRAGQSNNVSVQLAALDRTLRERPQFVEAKLAAAQMHLALDDPQAAKRLFLEAVAQVPALRESPIGENLRNNIGFAFHRRSIAAYNAGNWEATLRFHQETFNVEPTAPRLLAAAHNGYAWTLTDKLERDYRAAEKSALEAVRLDPREPAFADTLAWVYYKQGRYQPALEAQLKALEFVKKARNPSPEMAEYYYHLGAIYEKLGNKAEARSNYLQALNFNSGFAPATEGLLRVDPGVRAPGSTRTRPVPRNLRPSAPLLPRRSPAQERGLI